MTSHERNDMLEQALLEYIERYGLTEKARACFIQNEAATMKQSSEPAELMSVRAVDPP